MNKTIWRFEAPFLLVFFLSLFIFLSACMKEPAEPVIAAASVSTFPGCDLFLVSLDTLRADRLPAYGYEKVSTPGLKQLETESILFSNCHTQAMVTAPSHMTLFTSTHPRVHRVKNLGSLKDPVYYPLPRTLETLAEVLQRNGYRTAAFTDGGNVSPYLGFDRGFEVYDARNEGIFVKVHRVHEYLKERSPDERIFLFLHTYEVHDYLDPETFAKLRFEPNAGGSLLREGKSLEAYDSRIENCDRALAWLFERMERLGRYNPAIIVVTSDHGESFYEHGYLGHLQFFRETSHVPLFLRLPSGSAGGRRIEDACGLVDLMPTLLELMGIEGPPQMQGRSLVNSLEGEALEPLPVLGDRIDASSAYSVFFKQHKLIRDPLCRPPADGLFHPSHDPGESRNLSAEKRSLLQELSRIGENHLKESAELAEKYGSGRPTRLDDPELIEKLKQLGY